MEKINVFYHIFICENAELLIDDQLNKLLIMKSQNPSIRFFVNINSNNKKFQLSQYVVDKISKLTENISFYYENHYEFSTLSLLYEHAKQNSDNFYLYMHTKGVSRINDPENGNYKYKNVENWRNIMEHFCIEQWRYCLRKLPEYDLVGCNYIPQNSLWTPAHFSGAFFWSKSSFINKLVNPKSYITDNMDRFNAEFWVGTQPHRSLSLYPIPKPIIENHCRLFSYTPREEYENNIIEEEFINL